ncbi:hypothetical protein EON83_03395 [bacterium]|nr:MAG: hypothetical protein EON83_03395 [bacterium]
MRKLLLFPLLLGSASNLLAAPTTAPKPPAAATAKAAEGMPNEGELRLDGKIAASVGPGQWQLDAISWTSPRGVTTTFDDVKPKSIQLAPDAFVHARGSMAKIDVNDVKLKATVAVIGKNGPGGTVLVRELILINSGGNQNSVGVLSINPISSGLIDQSRRARDAGQYDKALEFARKAAETAAARGDVSGEALCTEDIGLIYNHTGQSKNAIETFKHVQSLGERLNNPMVQVLALQGQAGAYTAMGQLDTALSLLERAVPISAPTINTLQISTLSSLANVYTLAKKNNEAVATLLKVFPIEEAAGKYDDATETLISVVLLQSTTDAAGAKARLDEVRGRMGAIRDESKRLDLTVAFAGALKVLKDDAGAAQQYEAAAKLAEDKGKPEEAARIRDLAAGKTAPATPAAPGDAPGAPDAGPANPPAAPTE